MEGPDEDQRADDQLNEVHHLYTGTTLPYSLDGIRERPAPISLQAGRVQGHLTLYNFWSWM